MIENLNLDALSDALREQHIYRIYLELADASQGTVDADRAMKIARRAVDEACDNREGK